jgi:hypothetical protein
MSTQAETINMNRILYKEWFPQIVYDHHQAGPPGTVMFAPPFRDPFNYLFDPLIPSSIDLVGAADARALRPRRQARRDDATWIDVLDVVEWRAEDDGVFSQSDRAAHRKHRQPDADRDSVCARTSSCQTRICRIRLRRSAGTSASRSSTR